MEIARVKKIVDKVDGWLDDAEGELLYNLAKNCKGRGVIVEIGSWMGKSTIWLGLGSKAGKKVKVYAVDPHARGFEHKKFSVGSTFREFKKNIDGAGVDDVVVPIISTSEEASKKFRKPVELVFIDGAHEYEHVKKDFELWFPKVIDGGIVAFHDTIGRSGPRILVDKLLFYSNKLRNAGFIGSTGPITFAEKVRQTSAKDRFRNKCVLLLKMGYIVPWLIKAAVVGTGMMAKNLLQ